ncbi:tRNA pseudouridine(38-40) synthase TruA [[Clostridium] leptum]|uniref:tRNA pseudouridine synthase A n=1 Tax=Solibaculum mannosilyticum TaxID=2780922 RepID=A0A7I8D3X8_9FIRM|nr:tRNA pseudouridine(38-40) synthase TruA [Solibaculum mannosilyticum]MCO7136006.1 tRNA pseudouridine(38-40) synthase TruA [[Clostridium] leptum]BCI61516.1 tRNA pseudouridine synthase A [Solibaculum mannosilyticum]
MSRTLLLTLRYDGSRYHGWQVQQNAVTVQEVFQNALGDLLGTRPDLKACSRTDTGVHADMFCISFETDSRIPCGQFPQALNMRLPRDIAVYGCREVEEGFHARYHCLGKRYVYQILNTKQRNPFYEGRALHYRYPLDEKMLHQAAQQYVGQHNFSGFCSYKSTVEDTVRTVSHCSVERKGDLVTFSVQADGFLYNMVRIMVGTLLRIAQGKFRPDCIPVILEKGDRALAGPTAPAEGLYLSRVLYAFDPLEEQRVTNNFKERE